MLENKNILTKISSLDKESLDLLCKEIREAIIKSVSINGGHLSSNLGSVESIVSMLRVFDIRNDKIVFDVGHQAYAYKLLTGRSLNKLRKKDGISGFIEPKESKYDIYSGGHSSTSISIACGIALGRDLNKDNYEVVAYIGDGSMLNGLAYEGINNLYDCKSKVILVVNDNGMTISKTKKSIPSLLQKQTFVNLGFEIIGPIDGHNIFEMDKAFAKAKNNKTTTIIYLKTIKGKGYKPSEEDVDGFWHSTGAFDIKSGEKLYKKDNETKPWSYYFSNEIGNLFDEKNDTILISPATHIGSNLFDLFKKYPNRCFDVGIQEEHSITISSGLSIANKNPFVSIYSTFLQRTFDELYNEISRNNQKLTLLVERSGLVGEDGSSHQGIYDASLIMNIPHSVVCMASDTAQIKDILNKAYTYNGLFSVRIPKENIKVSSQKYDEIAIGAWIFESLGSEKTALISYGPVIKQLKNRIKNKNITLINAVYQWPILDSNIKKLMNFDKIVIFDPYSIEEGFCLHLISKLLEKQYKGIIVKKCVPNIFIPQGTIEEQLNSLDLSVENIIKLL